MTRHRWLYSLISASGLLCSIEQAQALPISTGYFPAPFIAGQASSPIVQYQHIDAREALNGPLMGAKPYLTADVLFLSSFYLFTADIGLAGSIPWIKRNFTVSPPGAKKVETKTSGWSDAALTGIFRLWDTAGKGWYSSIALFPAVIFPTGDWDQKNSSGPIDRVLQPGTGNWSGLLSLAAWYADVNKEVTFNVQYQKYIKGHDFRFGDRVVYNASFGYRLFPWTLTPNKANQVETTLNLEFLGTYQGRPHGTTIADYSQNWGRMSASVTTSFTKIQSLINFAYHQTVYYHTEGVKPVVRPERVYQLVWQTTF